MPLPDFDATGTGHRHPGECLPTLDFCRGDAGRGLFFANSAIPAGAGDCAAIAVAYATHMTYSQAMEALCTEVSRLETWKIQLPQESCLKYLFRRIRHWLAEVFKRELPAHRNPLFGVHTNAYATLLEKQFYRGGPVEPALKKFTCICNPDYDFVIDGRVAGRGSHVATIVQCVVRGDVDITQDNFEISNLWLRRRA